MAGVLVIGGVAQRRDGVEILLAELGRGDADKALEKLAEEKKGAFKKYQEEMAKRPR